MRSVRVVLYQGNTLFVVWVIIKDTYPNQLRKERDKIRGRDLHVVQVPTSIVRPDENHLKETAENEVER